MAISSTTRTLQPIKSQFRARFRVVSLDSRQDLSSSLFWAWHGRQTCKLVKRVALESRIADAVVLDSAHVNIRMLTAQDNAPYSSRCLCLLTRDEALSVGAGYGCIKHGVDVAFPVTQPDKHDLKVDG